MVFRSQIMVLECNHLQTIDQKCNTGIVLWCEADFSQSIRGNIKNYLEKNQGTLHSWIKDKFENQVFVGGTASRLLFANENVALLKNISHTLWVWPKTLIGSIILRKKSINERRRFHTRWYVLNSQKCNAGIVVLCKANFSPKASGAI